MVTALNPLDRKLVRDLWHIRGQVIAIAFVIACGVATVVMALGTLHSLQETRDAYYERYHFAHVFASVKRAPLSLLNDISDIPGVARAETRIVHSVILDIDGMQEPARGLLVSLPQSPGIHLNELILLRGRLPNPAEPDEVVVHEAFVNAHQFELGDSFSANMNERRRDLRIVGVALSAEHVYVIGPGDLVPDNRRYGIFWMGRKALEAAFNLKGAFNEVSLSLTPAASEAAVISDLDRLIDPYGGVGAIGRDDQVSYAFLKSEMDQQATIASVMPPIFLGVAAFLLNLVISRLVQTEREQIGLLKAFGYSNSSVGIHYLKFVSLIVLVGVVIGWLLGIWLGRGMTLLYAEFFRFPFLYYIIKPSVFAIGALVSIAAATLGTLVAVGKAAKLPPAVAMTPPPPTSYKGSVAERLGVSLSLTQPTRMIIRHIFRWPKRALLTIIGISFAGALLVSTLFFLDSLDEMTNIFFFESERQDIAISLTEIRADRAILEAQHLPGVLRSEGVRQVSVRLRNGPRMERTSVSGLDQSSQLKRLLDVNKRAVDVPPHGLMLTDKLAELLDVAVGENLQIEFLEGRRPVVNIPITRIVKQYIGKAAYMDRGALNRLLKEGPVINTLNLQTESTSEGALFEALKKTPSMLGLMSKKSALQSFYDTIRQNIDTTIIAYIAFASVISVGVIYNAARISLSERARELASLRVLGFTKREVAYILAGELALLTWAALPLSAFLGYQLAAFIVVQFDTDMFRLPLHIDPSTYGYSAVVVMVSAFISGTVVVRRVANLDLISVLKTRE